MTELPFEIVAVPGTELAAALRDPALRARGYPVYLGDQESVDHLVRLFDEVDIEVEELLQRAGGIQVSAWVEARLSDDGEVGPAPSGPWPSGLGPPPAGMMSHLSFETGLPRETCLVGLVPAREPWEVTCHLGFGGWNECPLPEVHAAMHREWADKYGARVLSVTSDIVEMQVDRPPSTRQAALGLAEQYYAYCPDSVVQGMGTLEALAASLLEAPTWFFWWD